MKAKYHIGTLIKFTRGGTDQVGIVDAVVTRNVGFSYLLPEGTEEIKETDVLDGYQPIKKIVRTAKAPKKPKEKKGPVAA